MIALTLGAITFAAILLAGAMIGGAALSIVLMLFAMSSRKPRR